MQKSKMVLQNLHSSSENHIFSSLAPGMRPKNSGAVAAACGTKESSCSLPELEQNSKKMVSKSIESIAKSFSSENHFLHFSDSHVLVCGRHVVWRVCHRHRAPGHFELGVALKKKRFL